MKEYRKFGRTGWRVGAVGFGAWAIGGNRFGNSYGPTDDVTSKAALNKALDLGCNFFDTADIYGHGHSEELLGEVIGSRMERARGEISHWAEYEYVVINDDVDACFAKVREILHAERMERTRQTGLIPFVRELMG